MTGREIKVFFFWFVKKVCCNFYVKWTKVKMVNSN